MRNFRKYFDNDGSEGSLWGVEQRPAGAFRDLDDDQLRQFAWGTFEQFIHKLEPLV
jgi:hypothetical protein